MSPSAAIAEAAAAPATYLLDPIDLPTSATAANSWAHRVERSSEISNCWPGAIVTNDRDGYTRAEMSFKVPIKLLTSGELVVADGLNNGASARYARALQLLDQTAQTEALRGAGSV